MRKQERLPYWPHDCTDLDRMPYVESGRFIAYLLSDVADTADLALIRTLIGDTEEIRFTAVRMDSVRYQQRPCGSTVTRSVLHEWTNVVAERRAAASNSTSARSPRERRVH